MMELKEYAAHMEWDSYEGSLFRETSTTWEHAYDEQDARNRACSKYGHHKGFEIKFVVKERHGTR